MWLIFSLLLDVALNSTAHLIFEENVLKIKRNTKRNCLIILSTLVSRRLGRAIAQAVSRWLATAAARVRSRVWSSGICGGQSSAGAGFIRVLPFPLPVLIPPTAPHWSSIIRAASIGQKSGLSLTRWEKYKRENSLYQLNWLGSSDKLRNVTETYIQHVGSELPAAVVMKNSVLWGMSCSPLKVIRVIKSRRMRWAGHVAHEGR
jgi:hypothetical protein